MVLSYEGNLACEALFWDMFHTNQIYIMKKSIVRFGLIAVVLLGIVGGLPLLIWGTDMSYSSGEILGYASMLIALSMVFLGLKYFRDKENNGQLNFKQGFTLGMIITAFPAVAMGVFTYIFYEVSGDKFAEWALPQMSPEQALQYQEIIASDSIYASSLFQSVVMVVTVAILGVIVTLGSALILKREVVVSG